MSFCKGGFAKVKDFMKKVTPELEIIMGKITDVTGKIKAIEGNPLAEAIVAAIPIGSEIEGYLNKAMDIIVTGGEKVISCAEKITAWLENETEAGKDMKLVKLAQVSVNIADADQQHSQSFYDTAVQVHIEGLK